jgi:hypothetical protein
MNNKLILLDYDVGALGNSIYAMLSLTSENLYGPDNRNFTFNSVGNAHNVKSFSGFMLRNETIQFDLDFLNEQVPNNKYDVRFGHAFQLYRTLHAKYPGSCLIKIVCKEFGFIYQILAGYKKFSGFPTLDTANNFFNVRSSDYTEILEIFALSYSSLLLEHKQLYSDDTIMLLNLDDILDTNLESVKIFFETNFDFKFDETKFKDFQKLFKENNQDLIDRTKLIYNIAIDTYNRNIVSIPNLEFYEKALLLAVLHAMTEIDISNLPLYTDKELWVTNNTLIKYI